MTDESQRANEDQTSERTQFAVGDRGPFPGSAPARPDDDIRSDVESAFFYDELVSSLDIKVTVQGGTVFLSGTVNSDQMKRRAGEDAWRVAGVRNVMNDLIVHETPIPSRAAGQDEVPAKPPEPIFGQPPSLDEAAKAGTQATSEPEAGGGRRAA